ncbi:hypothetical protein [Nocardioides sp. 1609]|uniref:hypothetical protein n=1 Tax=Nocardioides sp. 1609 TaxID=2508327 RepID=UPI001431B0CB|nr:hypothetical protein [Nocardioides sp. 1609]
MKPLQSIAMGVVVLLLVAAVEGHDLLADPLGWVLVLVGVRALPGDFPLRTALLRLGVAAALVSLPLWVPGVVAVLDDADEALAWAVDLPRLTWYAVLCAALVRAADTAGDLVARAWWRTALAGSVLVIVLPVLVLGAGLDALTDVAGVVVALVPVVVVGLLFWCAGRAWAAGPSTPVTEVHR